MGANLREVLDVMDRAVKNPNEMIRKFKEETGGKAVGCFPIYCPEEIVHAGGMFPVGCWGGQTSISAASEYLQAFACSIMQSCMEFTATGVYKELSAALIPAECDTLKALGQNFRLAAPDIKEIIVVHPHQRKEEAGMKFLANEYETIRKQLEEVCGRKITDEQINSSIAIYNENRRIMRMFAKIAGMYPLTITPTVRHLIFKSRFFMLKEKHTELMKQMIDILNGMEKEKFNGKRVILTGIQAEPDDFLELIYENGMVVVGDDLAQESRQVRADVPEEGGDVMRRLAQQWGDMEGCSLAYDPGKGRAQMLVDLAKEMEADGAISCMMKFCDPEEFDFPIIHRSLTKAGFPVLSVEIDQQVTSFEQARTRLQGFAEIL